MGAVKVGIVVPYSWSFWGGVVEHAELQADALRRLGCEVKTIMGNDPPGQFTRVLHPRHGRHGMPPPDVIPIGRSVIVPANGTLPNIILSPRSVFRIKQALARERFDVVHLHEPMTPTPCIATLAMCTAPMVATFHASGDLGWMKVGKWAWGFLAERLDHRIAVSERARESAARWLPGDYEIVPNGVLIPAQADASGRQNRIVFAGRHEASSASSRRRSSRANCSRRRRSSRPRSAARASGSSSSGRWRARRPSSPQRSRDTAT